MKLGRPTKTIAAHTPRTHGKYTKIYEAVEKLPKGEWLPVIFDTSHDAYNFRMAVETHRTRLMEAKLRGSVVYVRGRSETVNGKQVKK